jgi:hypothetical protein
MFGGGAIVSLLKLTAYGCLKLVLIMQTVATALTGSFYLLGCDNQPIVGLDTERLVCFVY